MRRRNLIFVFIICISLSACSTAIQTNSPAGTPTLKDFAPSSQTPISSSGPTTVPTPKTSSPPTAIPLGENIPVAAKGWRSAKIESVCLRVEQEYPELPDNYNEPIAPTVEELLKLIGIQVKSSECDAYLEISLVGTGAYAIYQVAGGKSGERCFNGGEYSGDIKLTAEGYEELVFAIQGKHIPKGVTDCLPEPSADADYVPAWSQAIIMGFEQFWSAPGLLHALDHSSLETQTAAAIALGGQNDLDAENISTLVDALNIKDIKAQQSILNAIKSFGTEAWEAIPPILLLWESMGDNAYHPFLAQQWGEYHNALVKITAGTSSPGEDCSGPAGLKCWKAWWGDGRPAP